MHGYSIGRHVFTAKNNGVIFLGQTIFAKQKTRNAKQKKIITVSKLPRR